MDKIEELGVRLFDVEAVKFGDFVLKSGLHAPVYFDLRIIISYPDILEQVCHILCDSLTFDKRNLLCGVPYTALPIATIMSVKCRLPMLIRRKEQKQYGTKKLIEGKFSRGDNCIIVEDVITSGMSIVETVNDLRNEGLCVDRAVIILDREQGGKNNLESQSINVKSIFTMMQFMEILLKNKRIDTDTFNVVKNYIRNNQTNIPETVTNPLNRTKIPFEQRSELTKNAVTKQLFMLMVRKKTNLCVAVDLVSSKKILDLFDSIGPYICMFKTHIDIIEDFTQEFIDKLVTLAKKHDVILMEDRKYADIGNTVALQCSGGTHHVNQWADVVTAHTLSGSGILKAIKSSFSEHLRGIFLVMEMSSEGNLLSSQYVELSLKMIEHEEEAITGFVSQSNIIQSPGLIQLTPGVKINTKGDNFGQNYNSPESVILQKGADIAVVGRGITEAKNPVTEAKVYRDILWQSYESRIK